MAELAVLPDDAEELATWAEPHFYLMTMEKGKDGTLYLCAWTYGAPTVLFSQSPNGLVYINDDFNPSTPSAFDRD